MHWLYLALAIVLEVAGTTSMKISSGLTKLVPSVLVFVFYGGSIAMLALALKRLDISIAYAVWAGLGTATIAVIGITYFQESVSAIKLVSIALIIVGVVGLNLSGTK
ncbi:MAG: multidrug efflux SMR transporter [Porticoccaceae bacterium]|nr:multidrug efflux SMR transporter [Porticoccaceae bacterium]